MATQTGSVVTDEQVGAFREQGFLVIPRLINDAAVGQLRTAYDELMNGAAGDASNRRLGDVVRQIVFPSSYHATFADNPARRAAHGVARMLLGREPEFFFDMLISKAPGAIHATPWHQDYAYAEIPFVPAGSQPLNEWVQFWVALDDADEENGCMNFIPGSHLGPLRAHYVYAGEPQHDNRMLATEDYDDSRAVCCPVPAGGCTVHIDGTLHYTGGNHSDRLRRAYIFNFRPLDRR